MKLSYSIISVSLPILEFQCFDTSINVQDPLDNVIMQIYKI